MEEMKEKPTRLCAFRVVWVHRLLYCDRPLSGLVSQINFSPLYGFAVDILSVTEKETKTSTVFCRGWHLNISEGTVKRKAS